MMREAGMGDFLNKRVRKKRLYQSKGYFLYGTFISS